MFTEMEPYAPFALGPESVAWRVHASPVTLLGGVRALMIQALRPAAMAGVADHSSYQDDVALGVLGGGYGLTSRWLSASTASPSSEPGM